MNRFEERFAQTRLRSRSHVAGERRGAFRDPAFRERLHGVVLMLVSLVGLATGGLVAGLGLGALIWIVIGVYGLHLWRRSAAAIGNTVMHSRRSSLSA